VTVVVWGAFTGASVAAIGVFLVLAVGGPLVLDILGVDSLATGPRTRSASFSSTPTEFSMGVGPGVLGKGAFQIDCHSPRYVCPVSSSGRTAFGSLSAS